MALFFRNFNIFGNGRLIFSNTNRSFTAGLKSVKDKIKEANIPVKPKKPLSPYFRYVQEQRSTLLSKNPNLKVTEIASQCAKMWKNIDPNVKERYEEIFKKELEDYNKEVLTYESKLTPEQRIQIKAIYEEAKNKKKRRELNKVLRDNNKPKRPFGAYLIYLMEQQKKLNKPIKELLPIMKGKWAELPDSEKAKYMEAAKKAKEVYEQEMGKWESQMIKEGKLDIVRNKTLEEVKPKLRGSNKSE